MNEDLEGRLDRFERDRRSGPVCGIETYLHDLGAVGRLSLLVEILCIDLEYRWRESRLRPPILLEGEVGRFPELGSLDELPVELIAEEYRARIRWGDRPGHAATLSRFRDRHDEIVRALVEVDREIEADGGRADARSIDPPPDPIELDAGAEVVSHADFLLRRLIGAGRMGKVFRAVRHADGREFAVKFLRKGLLAYPEVVRRFLGEGRTIARLRHPNLVGIEGVGRTPNGSYFLVMDLVRGPNLAEVAAARAIEVVEAVRWGVEVCRAIEHAHERGVVHCDLKPANLLLDETGTVRVTDFGLARSLGEETGWTAELEGTAPFMAPEQVSEAWGGIDERADVYAIGATIYTLLAGRPPFPGTKLADVLALVAGAAVCDPIEESRPDVPATLAEVCRRCLAKSKADRFAGVRELRRALEVM